MYLQADLNRGGVLWGGLQQLAGVHEAAESQLLQELPQVCRRGDHCVFDLHACLDLHVVALHCSVELAGMPE